MTTTTDRPTRLDADRPVHSGGSAQRLSRTMIDHAYQGVAVQTFLRLVLIVFVVLTSALLPPANGDVATYVIAAAYVTWMAVFGWQARRGGAWPVHLLWPAVLVDVAALSALALVAGTTSAENSWTSEVLLRGFFIIPVIAALELRWRLSIVVGVPAVATYLTVSIITRTANAEPWASVILRTVVLTGLAIGCTLLARVQASRVRAISNLAADRDSLLTQLVAIEQHERANLAENLHDGALQYVLAARLDLDDLREQADADATQTIDRLSEALRESVVLLRSTVSELHPAVLEQSGLHRAVADLARTAANRGHFEISVNATAWNDAVRTSADPLLFSAARELLTNVVKHAHAHHVEVTLVLTEDTAQLTITDDGNGIPTGRLEQQLADGHIGIASHQVRLAAAGGELRLRAEPHGGTTADVWLPATVDSAPAAQSVRTNTPA